MPLYSYRCETCAKDEDRFSPIGARNEQVCACGTPLTRVWSVPAVQDDSLDEWNEHVAHEPVHFTSKRDKRLYLKQHGLMEFVRHVGLPGSDKNPGRTDRWV